VLARIAAFAATDRPLAYFMGLRRVLGLRQGPDDTALTDLLSLRPEGLLERHRDFRNRDDWQRFFRAGGQFATLPQRDRSVLCCQVAIEHDPRLVKYLPLPIIQAHPALLLDAAGRDGRTLESMPFARIQPGNPFREALVEAAYASPRPPRIQHVPSDRLTEARCIQSLKWAPLDLPKVPDNQITLPICLASIRHTPREFEPPFHGVPQKFRGEPVARALLDSIYSRNDHTFPLNSFLPNSLDTRFFADLLRIKPGAILTAYFCGATLTLDMLAMALGTSKHCLRGVDSADHLRNLLLRAARASGVREGEPLPTGSWPPGLLPRDLSDPEVLRWMLRVQPELRASIPEKDWDDEAFTRNVLTDAEKTGLRRIPDRILERDIDWLAKVVHRDPSQLDNLQEPTLRRLNPELLDAICNSGLRQNRVPGYTWHLLRLVPNLLREETRQLAASLRPTKEPAAPAATAHFASTEALEHAVDGDWRVIRGLPPEMQGSRSLILLGLYGTRDPLAFPPHSVDDEVAFSLGAIRSGALFPYELPDQIKNAATFRAAIQTLSWVPFNPEVYSDMTGYWERGHDPEIDAWVTTMIGRHLQEDPRRALQLLDIPNVEWGAAAYRLGLSLDRLAERLHPEDHADFLAEIGPFPASMPDQVHPMQPAVGSSSSSSSAAATSGTRPS